VPNRRLERTALTKPEENAPPLLKRRALAEPTSYRSCSGTIDGKGPAQDDWSGRACVMATLP